MAARLTQAQLLQPGYYAQIGINAGQPILTAISNLSGLTSFIANFVQIAILFVAWLIVVLSFFIIAIQLFVTLIEFKLTTLAGFVLVPFGLFWTHRVFSPRRSWAMSSLPASRFSGPGP